MNNPTVRELMLEKLERQIYGHGANVVTIRFQKWTGWITPERPILVQSYLFLERDSDGMPALFIVRAYADHESPTPWRDFFPFGYAGDISNLSELVVEMRNHPDLNDPDYPLIVTEYDALIENLPEMVANDAHIRLIRF